MTVKTVISDRGLVCFLAAAWVILTLALAFGLAGNSSPIPTLVVVAAIVIAVGISLRVLPSRQARRESNNPYIQRSFLGEISLVAIFIAAVAVVKEGTTIESGVTIGVILAAGLFLVVVVLARFFEIIEKHFKR